MKANVKLSVEKMKVIVTTGNEEQRQTVNLDFKVSASIRDLARALYWQNKGCPLYVIIGSDQVELDLDIRDVQYQLELVPINQSDLFEKAKTDEPKLSCHSCHHEFTSAQAAAFPNGECPDCGCPFLPPPEKETEPGRKPKKEIPGTVEKTGLETEPSGNGDKPSPITLKQVACSCKAVFPAEDIEVALKNITPKSKSITLRCKSCDALSTIELTEFLVSPPPAETPAPSESTASSETKPAEPAPKRKRRTKAEIAVQKKQEETPPASDTAAVVEPEPTNQCANCGYVPLDAERETMKDNTCPLCEKPFAAVQTAAAAV